MRPPALLQQFVTVAAVVVGALYATAGQAVASSLNPIELLFAKLNALLRKAAERSIPPLWDRIGDLLDQFSTAECRHYLAHTGYV